MARRASPKLVYLILRLFLDFHDLNKKFRDVCWDLKKRGAVGETCLHLCMLNATSLHADLAKRLLRFYPKLINDIYMSDEYYGMYVYLIKSSICKG